MGREDEMRFVMAVLRALLSIATAPLRMLGLGGQPMTPATIAAAAMEAELDEGGDDEAERVLELPVRTRRHVTLQH